MGETPTLESPPPPTEIFPEPSVNGQYSPSQHANEGLKLDSIGWDDNHLAPAPEFLATAVPPVEALPPPAPEISAEPVADAQPEISIPITEDESKPADPIYTAAEGWTVSGSNSQSGELILKRENPDFPTGYEVVRVEPSQYQEAQLSKASEPAPEPEPQLSLPEADEKTDKIPPGSVLTDKDGHQWRYLSQSEETGMHKIHSLTANHTKFLPDERMADYSSAPEDAETPPELAAAAAALAGESEPLVSEPEKDQLRLEVQELQDRIARLESLLQTKDSPYEIKEGGIVPVYSWAKGYESARIVEEGERNGEAFYKVMTAEGETKTFFKDEVEYWFSHRAEPENAPQSKAEAQKHFSQKFQAVRQELMRLGGKTKSAIAEKAVAHVEAAKEALEPTAADIRGKANYMTASVKNAASMTGMMTQVLAEKAGDAGQAAAKAVAGAAKETVVYPTLFTQVASEKARENMPMYRRRLIGRAAGYAAVFSVWLLGPSEVSPTSQSRSAEDNPDERVEAPPLAA